MVCWPVLGHRLGAIGIGLGLVADGFQAGDALFQGRVIKVGNAAFDGVVEALEPQSGLGGALVQFGKVLATAVRPLLAADGAIRIDSIGFSGKAEPLRFRRYAVTHRPTKANRPKAGVAFILLSDLRDLS